MFVPVQDTFGQDVVAYMLIGLAAEQYQPDLNTDAAAMYLRSHQNPEGEWPYALADSRPPLCSEYIGQTALAMRALQLYAPKTDKAGYDRAVQLAAGWIEKARASNTNDRDWRVIGLAWAGNPEAAGRAMRELLETQRPDGGWSDLPSMESSAYATGKSLVALQIAGLPVSDAAYQRGVRFLLNTQQEDGTWYVRTRALGFQPFFDSGFPGGVDQFISAAGTNWATLALSLASPARTGSAAQAR
jgi:squalene cyclase